MTTYYHHWPLRVLMPVEHTEGEKDYRNTSGGEVLGGGEQVVASDAGKWRGAYRQINIRTHQQVRAWNGMDEITQGRLTPFLAPIAVNYRRPSPDGIRNSDYYAEDPYSDGSYNSDGSGTISMLINVSTSADMEFGSVTLDLILTASGELEPGQRFFIYPYLYVINRVVDQDGLVATVKIWPPLNADVPAGTRLDFDHPMLLARLATDDEMGSLPLRLNRVATRDVSFVEALEEPE